MKKLLRNLSVLCFVLAAFLTTGCYEKEVPFLEVDREVILVGPSTDKGTVVVESNLQWAATSEVEWITLDNGFGNHKGTFEFFVAANTTPNERTGKIVLKDNDGLITKTILVRQQSEGSVLTISTEEISFTKDAGEYLMSIACNGEWKVASSADWCKVEPNSGSGNGSFKISVDENASGADRVATISILTEADGKTEVREVTVYQSASNAVLVVSPESQQLTAAASTFELDVITSGSWSAAMDSDWLTLSATSGKGDTQITVSATKNDTGRERIAIITFATGAENENRVIRQIVVRQAAVDFYLVVPVTDYPLSLEEQSIQIPYVLEGSNVTVSASSSVKWMSVASVADGIAIVNVEENGTANPREGIISFVTRGQDGDPIVRQVRVAQAPTINLLDVLADEYAVEWTGETFRIPIYSNTPVIARSSEAWCNVAVDGQDVVINVTENTTATPRVAIVTVTTSSDTGAILSKTTIIRQAAAYSELVVSPAEKSIYATAQSFVASIVTNNSWAAQSDSEWLTIDKANGTGDYMLTVTAAENKTGRPRTAIITIQTGAENSQRESATITVTQNAEQFFLEVPVRFYPLGLAAQTIEIPYSLEGSNVTVSASSNVKWMTVTSVVDGIATVSVEENKTGQAREGIITFMTLGQAGNPEIRQVAVAQAPTINILDVLADEYAVEWTGETFNIPIYSNTPVSVRSSETWCNVAVDGQNIVITVPENNTSYPRTAIVTVTTDSESGDIISKTTIVRQAAAYSELVVSPETKNIYAIAQSFVASIVTNNSWTASSDSNWLTIDKTEGTGDYMLTVNAAENKTGQVRVAVITVQTGAENSQRESATITVTQRPEQFYFEVPVRSFLFDKWGGLAKVSFVTSGNEESVVASSNVDWLRVGDIADGIVNVGVQENKTAEARTGIVTITCTPVFGDPIAIPVTFTQSPTVNILDVFVDVIDVSAKGDDIALPYYANTPVSVSSSEEWCHVMVTEDEDSYHAECCSYSEKQKIIKIEVDPNRTGEARIAYVTIATVNDAGEKITKVITVRQAALYAALSVTPKEVVIPATETEFAMTINTTGTWWATNSSDWLTNPVEGGVSTEAAGFGDAVINWTASENTTGYDRRAQITVATGPENNEREEQVVNVIQLARDTYIEIPIAAYAVTKDQQTLAVYYFAAGDFTDMQVNCSEDWIQYTGGDENVLNFAIAENTTAEPRTAVVTVTLQLKAGEPISDSFIVTQAPTINILDVYVDNYEASPWGEVVVFPFYGNTEVSASVSAMVGGWCSVIAGTPNQEVDPQEIAIDVKKNESAEARTAYVTLTTVTDKGEKLTHIITIHQNPLNAALVVSPEEVVLPAHDAQFDLTVVTTGKWDATVDCTWLDADEWSGEGDYIITWEAGVNDLGVTREATITVFTGAENENRISKTVHVTQLPYDTYLEIPQDAYLLPKEKNDEFEVACLIAGSYKDVIVDCSAPWIVFDEFSNNTLSFKVAENTTAEPRTATVSVAVDRVTGEPLTDSFTVTQAGTYNILEGLSDRVSVLPIEDTIKLPVITNVKTLRAVASENWLTSNIKVDENFDIATVEIYAAANNTGKDRHASLTLITETDKGQTLEKKIMVFQPAVDTYFAILSGENVLVNKVENDITVTAYASVNANEVTMIPNAPWITVKTAPAATDQIVEAEFTVAENTTGVRRQGEIIVTFFDERGDTVQKRVIVNQSATDGGDLEALVDFITVAAAGETVVLTFETEDALTATPSATWITAADIDNTTDPQTLTITAAENTTGLDRTAYITVSNGSESKIITVFQPAKDTHFALLSPDIIYIDSKEQDVNITAYGSTVDDKDDMTFRSDASWLTGKPKTINGQNVSRPFTAAENTAEEARAASILVTFVDEAGKTHTATVQIVQAGAKDDSILEALVDEVIMDPAGETLKIGFIAKDELSSALSSSAWLKATVNADKSFVKLVAEPNTTGRDRKAYVTVKNSKKTALITVDQPAGATEFTILTPSKAISSAKQNVVLRAYCSEEFELADVKVSSDAEWLTLGTKEFGSDTRVVRVPAEAAANTTGDARTAVVTFTLIDKAGKTHQGEATVLQSPSDNILDVYVSTMVVPYLEIEDRLPIYDNATNVVARSSNASWLYASIITNDNGTRDVKIKIAKNETGEPRTGVVTVTAKFEDGTQAEKVITVFQAAKGDEGTPAPAENYFFFAVDAVTLPKEATTETVKVFTNAEDYTLESSETWLTAAKGSVVLNATENDGTTERVATVTATARFADGTTKTYTLPVTQTTESSVVQNYLNVPSGIQFLADQTALRKYTINTNATSFTATAVFEDGVTPWFTVSPEGDMINVTPTANPTNEVRKGTIKIQATFADTEVKNAEIGVVQAAAPEEYLFVQDVVYRKQIDAAVTEVPVFTNLTGLTFEVTEGAAWITIPTSSDAKFAVKTADNETGAARTGKIKVSKGDKSAEVIVKQAYGSEDPNYFAISSEVVIDQETTISFPVHTNAINLEATVPTSCDWLSSPLISQEGDNWIITFKPVADKYYSTDKQVNISVKATYQSGSPLTETKTVTVKRQKDDLPYLDMPLQYFVPSSNVTVSTHANTNGTLSLQGTPASWCTVTLDGTNVRIKTEANPETTQRATQFTLVSTLGGGAGVTTKTVAVIQLGKPEPTQTPNYIECNLGVVEEDSPAVTVNVPFNTDALSYEVTTDAQWITISNQSAVSGHSASFDVKLSQNDSEKARVGVVTVTATFEGGTTKKFYLPVIQHAAQRYFVVQNTHYDLDFNGTGTLYIPYIANPTLQNSHLQVTINANTSQGNPWIEKQTDTGSNRFITSHSLVFKLTRENSSYNNDRSGTITITWTDPQDSSHTSTYVVTVVQPHQ